MGNPLRLGNPYLFLGVISTSKTWEVFARVPTLLDTLQNIPKFQAMSEHMNSEAETAEAGGLPSGNLTYS